MDKRKPSMWPSTRPSLMQGVQAGDEEAWKTLVSTYAPLLYRYCRSKGLQDVDAENVAQDVVTKVLRFRYQPERGKFRSWLRVVIRREIGRLRSRPTPGSDSPLEGVESSPEPEWMDSFYEGVLEVGLKRIRTEYSGTPEKELVWRAFELSWLKTPPMKATEVASELGQPIRWVYDAKYDVVKRLQKETISIAEHFLITFSEEDK